VSGQNYNLLLNFKIKKISKTVEWQIIKNFKCLLRH